MNNICVWIFQYLSNIVYFYDDAEKAKIYNEFHRLFN